MDKIRELMSKFIKLGPGMHGQSFITVNCYCDFEGHGRASETWEEHWSIVLPLVPHHWKGIAGWNKGGTDRRGMLFHGKTFGDVREQCIDFLEWYNENRKPIHL